MDIEIASVGGAVILALVQIVLPGAARSRQIGLDWNMGPRDEPPPPPSRLGGRLLRAQANLYETLPLFLAAALAVHLVNPKSALGAIGCATWLGGRVLYVPLYASGVAFWRSLVWILSSLGLVLLIAAIFGA